MRATLRHIEMIRAMPVGEWVTTTTVHQRLAEKGHKVTLRTVERDLIGLCQPLGITFKDWRNGVHNGVREWMRMRYVEAI